MSPGALPLGVIDDFGGGSDGRTQGFRAIGRQGEVSDYWEGE